MKVTTDKIPRHSRFLTNVTGRAGETRSVSTRERRSAAVALTQAGVCRTAQARAVGGYSADEIRALVRRGAWVRLRRGMLATARTVAAARVTSDGSFALSVAAEIWARSGRIVASHT